ncbi:hypothetical protein [Sinorhizobium meliloti]|uniref:hypothetical protein n=1 Tax=Rhizobium meliloti TaxID=382 RepID=UPI00398D0DF4
MPITVYDEYGQPACQVQTLGAATFIADIEGGRWELNPSGFVLPTQPSLPLQLRSRLRRIIRSGRVSENQACQALSCCPHTLVAWQLEPPVGRMTPPEFGIRLLEAYVAEQTGEAA